jgi:hypothetical protein
VTPELPLIWAITSVLVVMSLVIVASLAGLQIESRRRRVAARAAEDMARNFCLDIIAGGHGRLPHVALSPGQLATTLELRDRLRNMLSQDGMATLEDALRTRTVPRTPASQSSPVGGIDWGGPTALARVTLFRLSAPVTQP